MVSAYRVDGELEHKHFDGLVFVDEVVSWCLKIGWWIGPCILDDGLVRVNWMFECTLQIRFCLNVLALFASFMLLSRINKYYRKLNLRQINIPMIR